jgi:flagellar basal body-associated protein FliL
MATPNDPNTEKNEMRLMWIGSAVIVVLLLGAMGVNMLVTHNSSIGSTETTSQSGTVPPK